MHTGYFISTMIALILSLILIVVMMSGCMLPAQTCYCPTGQYVCETRPIYGPHIFPRAYHRVCYCRVPKICYSPVIEADYSHGRN